MTLAEITRAIESKQRVIKAEEKEKAVFIYTLADLIGYSVGRIHNKSNKLPSIEEAFPAIFEESQEDKEKKKLDRFKAQLLQFTNSHNEKLKGDSNG